MTVFWSVPQACVWVRTRDQNKADQLDPMAARTLMVAADLMRGLYEARACLQAALLGGSLVARGRLARRYMETGSREWRNVILEDGPRDVPLDFWRLGGALEDSDDADGMPAVRADEVERWVRVEIDRDAVVVLWPAPYGVLREDDPLPLGALIEDGILRAPPLDNCAWFLGHRDVIVPGVNGNGQRVRIDRETLATRPFGIVAGDSITVDTRRWEHVNVTLAPKVDLSDATPNADAVDPEQPRETPKSISQAPPPAPLTMTGAAHVDEAPPIEPTDDEKQPKVNDWYRLVYVPMVQHHFPGARPSRDNDAAVARTANALNCFTGLREMVHAARAKHAPPEWSDSGSRSSENTNYRRWLAAWRLHHRITRARN